MDRVTLIEATRGKQKMYKSKVFLVGKSDKDLIAFDGHLYQVLSLPCKPVIHPARVLRDPQDMEDKDPATIRRLIQKSLGGNHD